jgi:hypothetical protein
VVLGGLGFEELDALLAQGKGDFHALLAKRQFGGGRQAVGDDLNLAQGFIRVLDLRAHRGPLPCVNIR